jgi:hypothetical protein
VSFITEREELDDQVWNIPVGLACRSRVAGITSPLRNWMFSVETANISNLSMMKTTDKYLILLIAVGIWADRIVFGQTLNN